MASIAGIRDSRVSAHARALEDMDRGALFEALALTSAMVGNFLARTWDGSYDVEHTHAYLRVMTDHQLGLLKPPRKAIDDAGVTGPVTDGIGSASAAAGFGAREFTQQDPRQWELTWHHQTGGNPRPEHADMDGTTVPADIGFTVDPGIGAPGCACVVEPVNPKTPAQTAEQVRETHELRLREFFARAPKDLLDKTADGKLIGAIKYLRGTTSGPLSPEYLAKIKEAIVAQDKLIAKYGFTYTQRESLFRGVIDDDGWFAPEVGKIWTDKGYTFASMSANRAAGYAGGAIDNGWGIEILTKAGTKVMPYDRHIAVLLPRNLRYRILSVDRVRRMVVMEVV
jgi:hypothetical protein